MDEMGGYTLRGRGGRKGKERRTATPSLVVSLIPVSSIFFFSSAAVLSRFEKAIVGGREQVRKEKGKDREREEEREGVGGTRGTDKEEPQQRRKAFNSTARTTMSQSCIH
ncbi:hypothetical protein Taro_054017 [Colocasia esculenta]|uniref:Uncharacterized protein n=1 Tax=Colocasia esculenta TaxID=4460 RepID=A0A843XPX7_COLES|nr:hypothetical protein [Colocasia esculenta]